MVVDFICAELANHENYARLDLNGEVSFTSSHFTTAIMQKVAQSNIK